MKEKTHGHEDVTMKDDIAETAEAENVPLSGDSIQKEVRCYD